MIVYVNWKKPPKEAKNVIYRSGNISLISHEEYVKLNLLNGSVLFLWGAVYGVYLSNERIIPIEMEINGREMLESLFSHNPVSKAISLIEGSFIGLIIKEDKEVILFGDALNRKEIFYATKGDGFIASTGLEAIIKAVDAIRYSQNALVNLLTVYGYYAPKKHTIYKNIHRLGVDEKISVTTKGVKLEKKDFQPLKSKPFGLRENREYVDILKSAVEIRSSDRCNWIYMSSGYDSSALLALLVDRFGSSKVRCVIGRMRYSERSGVINQFELDRAMKIADYFGVRIDVTDFDFTGKSAITFWDSIAPKLRNQHLYSYTAYNYYRLAEFVQRHGEKKDSVFVGAISDGAHNLGFSQFATILEHPDIGFREYSDKMASYLFGPGFFKRCLDGKIEDDFVYQALKNRIGNGQFDDVMSLNEIEKKVKFLASFFHRNRRIPFLGLQNSQLVTKRGFEDFESEMTNTYLKEVAEKLEPETVYSCILYLYNSYFWQGSTERCMTAGILDLMGKTITSPYWDGRLQRFLSEMPEDWGRGLELKPTKYPLKWMLQNAIDYPLHLQTGPHSYLYDVNPQFSHTSEFLFGSHFRTYLQDLLKDFPYEEVLNPSHFNLRYINSLVKNYTSGEEFGGQRMSDLLPIVNLCLVGWY